MASKSWILHILFCEISINVRLTLQTRDVSMIGIPRMRTFFVNIKQDNCCDAHVRGTTARNPTAVLSAHTELTKLETDKGVGR